MKKDDGFLDYLHELLEPCGAISARRESAAEIPGQTWPMMIDRIEIELTTCSLKKVISSSSRCMPST